MSDDRPGGKGWRRALGIAFDSVPSAIAGALILAGVAIIFANVVSRYLFSAAIFWAEEILVFMVVGLVAVSAIAVSFNRAHLSMDLLLARARGRLKRLIDGAIVLVFVACCGFVVVQSVEMVAAFHRTGTVSIAAGVPLVVPHTVLLIGFALMIVAVLARILAGFRAPPEDEEDETWRG
ncbi:MAG: TRAP transporter small permease [Defluviicoccus sp.]|nr:TRAP transporter small permease [Defluviicoccus sp.]MDE0279235.1 TRAP transporter small permease [Defluviicoccus sp.]